MSDCGPWWNGFTRESPDWGLQRFMGVVWVPRVTHLLTTSVGRGDSPGSLLFVASGWAVLPCFFLFCFLSFQVFFFVCFFVFKLISMCVTEYFSWRCCVPLLFLSMRAVHTNCFCGPSWPAPLWIFFFFILLIWWIALVSFLNVKPTLHYWNKYHLVMIY